MVSLAELKELEEAVAVYEVIEGDEDKSIILQQVAKRKEYAKQFRVFDVFDYVDKLKNNLLKLETSLEPENLQRDFDKIKEELEKQVEQTKDAIELYEIEIADIEKSLDRDDLKAEYEKEKARRENPLLA